MIQKISEAFAPLKKLEDNEAEREEKFWKEFNDLKLPLYLIIQDSKKNKINLTIKFLNNSQKYKFKIFTKEKRQQKRRIIIS